MDFSLQCAWLLEAYGAESTSLLHSSPGLLYPTANNKRKGHGAKLRSLILSGDLMPKEAAR